MPGQSVEVRRVEALVALKDDLVYCIWGVWQEAHAGQSSYGKEDYENLADQKILPIATGKNLLQHMDVDPKALPYNICRKFAGIRKFDPKPGS